jgi:hypothetical protein
MQTFPLQRLLVDALAARAASLFSCSLAYTLACTPHVGAVLCARSRTPSPERLTICVPFAHTHPISLRTHFDGHRRILRGAETRTEGAILSAILFSLARTHCLALFACCMSHNSQPSPNRHHPHTDTLLPPLARACKCIHSARQTPPFACQPSPPSFLVYIASPMCAGGAPRLNLNPNHPVVECRELPC